ncbi:endonuclease/exonuclease/phosphatase family protein [Streptomyces sp. NBC_01433]|uniref:endonuclease/exonuclease/phosphatase family protein n=1 Tax=Streptomyces sp. NBC_01433 TaxID=2903864 RepID=UPI0022532CFF|nr:endonuclease/exonuclease/phosphatase family protein [Streptomyces sp. NBC_01433]MCX4681467.1 endonuclease/exonuclease/phosphatase family protein [Streptomyces sp. NBC_01433]
MPTPAALDEYDEPVVRIITLNLEKDGGEDHENGEHPHRWRAAHEELLAPRRPDVILRQEATYSHLHDQRRLRAAEGILGMRGFLSPNGSGRNPTALFLRPETFPQAQRLEQLRYWRTPPTIVVTQLAEVPEVDVVVTSWHAAFNSPRGREREAEELTALADKMKKGTAFIGGGDCNEYPLAHGETVADIDWASPDITDRVHIRHRTNAGPGGTRVSCTYLDDTLMGCGLHDPARYAAHELGMADALDSTAGHAAEGQGGGRRIDRIYVDPRTVQAVLAVRVLDTTGLSDHHAVEVVLSRRKLAEALRREFASLPPSSALTHSANAGAPSTTSPEGMTHA